MTLGLPSGGRGLAGASTQLVKRTIGEQEHVYVPDFIAAAGSFVVCKGVARVVLPGQANSSSPVCLRPWAISCTNI
jgi:hypothetical protein